MNSRRELFLVPLAVASARVFGGQSRRSYAESCLVLQKAGYLDAGPLPPMPKRLPRFDDQPPLGVNLFRMQIERARLENLTLTRTFVGRSELMGVSFENSDLSQSNLCWNDFSDVDFTDADLQSSDLRASTFSNVRFIRTNLVKADLRRSEFNACKFDGANMQGATAVNRQKSALQLSDAQIRQIAWTSEEGAEPGGG